MNTYSRLEVDDDVISGRTIKTIQGYVAVNFIGAGFCNFQDFLQASFCDDGGSMNAIFSRPEATDLSKDNYFARC